MVPVLVWDAVFMLVYRMRHSHKPNEPGEPLLHCVKDSLTEVEDQIWLLRNVFWWALLPTSISALAFFVHVGWLSRPGGWSAAIGLMVVVGGAMSILAFVYYLNQYAVRSGLEPRRQELLTLLTSLGDESTGEGADDYVALPALPFAEERLRTPCSSPARIAIGLFAFVVITLFLVVMLEVIVNTDPYLLTGEGYPKRSPFAGVRWQQSQPEVQLGEEWFQLVSLDEIPASEIVAFSRRTEGNKWRKRFEEDLVELLTRMGHPPQDEVTLVIQSLTSSETSVREDVPMTYANRRAIWNAARARAIPEAQPSKSAK
jgi:hypothetical protein